MRRLHAAEQPCSSLWAWHTLPLGGWSVGTWLCIRTMQWSLTEGVSCRRGGGKGCGGRSSGRHQVRAGCQRRARGVQRLAGAAPLQKLQASLLLDKRWEVAEPQNRCSILPIICTVVALDLVIMWRCKPAVMASAFMLEVIRC